MMSTRRSWHLVVPALLLLSAPAVAQEAPQPSALVVTADNLMSSDARHREMAERGGDAGHLLPGDVVRYSLLFTNVTDVPVRDVVVKDPIPDGLDYLEDSAVADREDVIVDYSIDGGQTYSQRPTIEVEIDGQRVERPAPAEMYTHVRWTIRGWVQPGAQVTAEFRARMPVPEGDQ